MIVLRAARAAECVALSDLCLRSKAVWGYDAAFLAQCQGELAVTPESLGRSLAQVAEADGRPVGYVEVTVDQGQAQLEKLFVAPYELKSGIGRQLLQWAADVAVERGAFVMTIESDPQAAGFYRRMGAVDDGSVASASIPGRVIPRLKLALERGCS